MEEYEAWKEKRIANGVRPECMSCDCATDGGRCQEMHLKTSEILFCSEWEKY